VPLCSIIIPVYNRASITRQCLNTLLKQSHSFETEIIVVDDGSRDLTPRVLAGYGDRIRVVTHAANAGFALTCNDGAAVASGEYLVFLNNDTLPQDGWLDALVRYAEAHPRAAVVGSKLLFLNDTIQHAGIIVCQDRFTRGIYTGFPSDHPAVNKSRRFQAVAGACMLVRRSAFEEVDGFDGAFSNAYEDHDFCLRLGERGHEIHYCHESVVYHLESVTRAGRTTDFVRATALYRLRWGHRLEPDDLAYYVEDGLVRFSYGETFPNRVAISPWLALIDGDERQREAERLLEARAGQVRELLEENTRLSVRLSEAVLRNAVAGPDACAGHTSRYDESGAAQSDDPPGCPSSEFTPPEELVQLTGGDYEKTGEELLQYFTVLGSLKPDESVLEVGCGVGRMAVPLTEYLSDKGRYEGFDVMPPAIQWCQDHITPRYSNFGFQHANIYNKLYNPGGNLRALEYRFPYRDDSFDFIFLTSVFTHMLPQDVEWYVSEVVRVLKPGGRCFSTYFLLNDESLGLMDARFSAPFDFRRGGKIYRVLDPDVPEMAVAHDEEHIRALYDSHGLRIVEPVRYGTWCGRLDGLSHEDIVLAEKVPD
jgi:GT2 family glycosyltransferase/SAM-dependent methyltransferase